MFGIAKIIAYFLVNKSGVVKYLPEDKIGPLLQASLVSAINLPHELLDLQRKRIKASLDPAKKTVVFCLTTRAYRGNFGNVIQKMRMTGRYNVIIIIGEMVRDRYEKQSDVFYLPNSVYDVWSYVDFADVCVTTRPFHTSKPKGKIIYFLHDVHDSAIGDIEENIKLVLDLDYFFVASNFIVQRLKNQVSSARKEYGSLNNRPICIIGGGYPKLDDNIKYFEKHKDLTSKNIVFATTAVEGPDTANLIAFPDHANDIIERILKEFPGHHLIFRPHPLTTQRKEIKEIEQKFIHHPNFTYDNNAVSYMENYAKSALMVTDMSGTAYTYAFTTLRPVVFFSPNEEGVIKRFGTYQYFIDRNKIGYVARNIDEMVEKIRLLLSQKDDFASRIKEYRDSTIYNIGKSEDYFVDNFEYIIEDKKHPDWIYI